MSDNNRDIMEAIRVASELNQMGQHNRRVVFGLLNDLLELDHKRSLITDENGEPFNRNGQSGKIENNQNK